MKSQQELFDDLFKDTIPKKYTQAMKCFTGFAVKKRTN